VASCSFFFNYSSLLSFFSVLRSFFFLFLPKNREGAREERNRNERVRLRDQRDEIEKERDVERGREIERPRERGSRREREPATLFPAVWKPILRWLELDR
jgi:hypothetical protein